VYPQRVPVAVRSSWTVASDEELRLSPTVIE
jgi:hypothetical protein